MIRNETISGPEGTVTELRDALDATILGFEINASKTQYFTLSIGAFSLDRVCDIGLTTIQFTPPLVLDEITNWKGNTVHALGSAMDIGSNAGTGIAQPTGTVITLVIA